MSCGTRAQTAARAIPMALGSSVLPSVINCLPNRGTATAGTALLRTAGDADYSMACDSATLRQPVPSPVLRLLWLGNPLPNSRCARPQPTPSPRYCSLTSLLLGTSNCTCRYCHCVDCGT